MNNAKTTEFHKIPWVKDKNSALYWLDCVRKCEEFDIERLDFTDISKKSDGKYKSVSLSPDAPVDRMKKAMYGKNVNMISMTGKYQDKKFVAGVDLRGYHVCFYINGGNDIQRMNMKYMMGIGVCS